MLCSRFLKGAHGTSNNALFRWSESVFSSVLAGYQKTLRLAMRHHVVVSLAALAMALVTVWMFIKAPKGFLPNEDTGRIVISTEAEQGVAFDRMIELQQRAADIVSKNPAVESFMSRHWRRKQRELEQCRTAFSDPQTAKRTSPIDEIIRQLRKDLSGIPGLKVFPQNPPAIRIGGTLTKSLYQFTLFGPDLDVLYEAAGKMEGLMSQIPGVVDVTTDLQITSPQVLVDINRDKASSLGISAGQIERALGNAYGARQISTIYTPTDQYRVILEADENFKRESADLSRLFVRSSDGQLVPLNTVAQFKSQVGPLTVQHLGQLPAVTLSFDLAEGTSLSDVVPVIQRIAAAELDEQISTQFQGTAQAFQSSLGNLGLLLLMAVLVIYIILGHSLRKLRSSANNPIRPAICGLWRAVDACPVSTGIERVRLRGPAHAHRHRQEERDHDDRLCPRRAAKRSKARRNRNLRRLHRPVSSHHDDDACRHDGDIADRPGAGRWR